MAESQGTWLRDAPSHESGNVTPPESDKPPYTHGREGFLLGELVDHGLGHAQERGDLLHVHEGLAQDILSGLGRSPPSDDRTRRPAHSDNLWSCSERFSDVFITAPCRFRPAPTANLVSCTTPRFPEHARGKAKPGGLEFPRLKQLSPGLSLSGNYCDSGAFHKRSGKGSGMHGESDSSVSECRLSPLEKHPNLVSGRFVTLRSYQCKRRFGAPESEVTTR